MEALTYDRITTAVAIALSLVGFVGLLTIHMADDATINAAVKRLPHIEQRR